MILIIDNYDSFTFNLVQYFGELGAEMEIFRNDKITVKQIKNKKTLKKIVISPGPCTPKEAGISKDVIKSFYEKVPILGVCLGHQCIGEVFGAKVVRAKRLMHGKTSMIYHDSNTIFKNIFNPFEATRYHSLEIEKESLPDCFQISAWTDQNEIMGIRHKKYPIEGVQFHPESILTKEGKKILGNFLKLK